MRLISNYNAHLCCGQLVSHPPAIDLQSAPFAANALSQAPIKPRFYFSFSSQEQTLSQRLSLLSLFRTDPKQVFVMRVVSKFVAWKRVPQSLRPPSPLFTTKWLTPRTNESHPLLELSRTIKRLAPATWRQWQRQLFATRWECIPPSAKMSQAKANWTLRCRNWQGRGSSWRVSRGERRNRWGKPSGVKIVCGEKLCGKQLPFHVYSQLTRTLERHRTRTSNAGRDFVLGDSVCNQTHYSAQLLFGARNRRSRNAESIDSVIFKLSSEWRDQFI